MQPNPPNLLFVIADDLAPGDLGCSGNALARTPHLDALAASGVVLGRHCSGPLCTPARAALLTGRHPYRTRAIDTYLGRSQLAREEITLATLLRRAGYATGLFGKWHLGDNPPCRPQDHGFDEVLMHLGGGLHQPSDPGRVSYFHPDLIHNGKLERYAGYCTDVFFSACTQWLDLQSAAGRPFFAYLATNAPHSPLYVGEKWSQAFRDRGVSDELARLYGMVTNIDDNVGRLCRWLAARNLTENTILIFTSDHGPCRSVRADRFNCGYRGRKGSLYEGGVRVPAFVSWPAGGWTGGRIIDAPTNPIDWLPTLAAAARTSVPNDRTIDGVDLGEALAGGPTSAWDQRQIPMQWHRGDIPEKFRNCAVFGRRYKWIRPEIPDQSSTLGQAGEREELYDIDADPRETNDLAAALPEVVTAYRRIYEAWFEDVGGGRADSFAPPRIELGLASQPLTLLTWQDWRPGQEGWSADNPGPWLVAVGPDATFALTIEFDQVEAGDQVEIACGEFIRRLPVLDRRFKEYHLDEIPLPAGPQSLSVLLHSATRAPVGPRRVWVHATCRVATTAPGGPRSE